MKKKKRLSKNVKIGAAIAATSLAIGSFFWVSTGKGNKVQVPAYEVLQVIDGDSFETTEHQRIRLASLDAPEIKLCGGRQAKTALEKMIVGKPVYLKVVFQDNYKRLISLVYTKDHYINRELIEKGYAYYSSSGKGADPGTLKKAGETARTKRLGIQSPKCTQTVNLKNPKCNIKGNTKREKLYFTPDCFAYNRVEVQLYSGDQWFCTEKEAQKAGFRKGKECP